MTFLRYLIGPELIWILACLLATTLKKINIAQAGRYNSMIESMAQFLPVIMLALTMYLFALPWFPKKFLLLRIIIAAIIGTNFLLEPILNAHTEGGPGVGMIYLVGYIILFVAIPIAIIFKVMVIK